MILEVLEVRVISSRDACKERVSSNHAMMYTHGKTGNTLTEQMILALIRIHVKHFAGKIAET